MDQTPKLTDLKDEIPLRVCMLAPCPFPANYGTPGSIREMAEAVAERGHEVHIVTYPTGDDIPLEGVELHRVGWFGRRGSVVVGPTIWRPLHDLQMVPKALKVIRRQRCDVIQAHGYEACLVAWLCRLATGLPIVYNGHSTMEDELASYNFIRPKRLAAILGRWLDRFVPHLADCCMPHSVNMLDFFQRLGLEGKIEPVLQIGINLDAEPVGDPAEVRRRYGLGDQPVVLYAGLLDEFQRLDLLLEAMVVIARQAPRVKLLVVTNVDNPGQLAALNRRAEELGVAGNLVVTEPQSLESMPQFLRASDVAVVPRPQIPGFPVKLINYMAAGCPTVMFASSTLGGLVHGENIHLASPDTGEALGGAILELLADEPLRRRLAENGRHFVREHHDRRLTAKQVCNAFYRVLATSGRLAEIASRTAVPV